MDFCRVIPGSTSSWSWKDPSPWATAKTMLISHLSSVGTQNAEGISHIASSSSKKAVVKQDIEDIWRYHMNHHIHQVDLHLVSILNWCLMLDATGRKRLKQLGFQLSPARFFQEVVVLLADCRARDRRIESICATWHGSLFFCCFAGVHSDFPFGPRRGDSKNRSQIWKDAYRDQFF